MYAQIREEVMAIVDDQRDLGKVWHLAWRQSDSLFSYAECLPRQRHCNMFGKHLQILAERPAEEEIGFFCQIFHK